MKKMLLLLAGMACLGMFVSCSDEPQEVVVSYDVGSMKGYSYLYYGTATGTVVSTGSYTYTIDSDMFATVSYADDVEKKTNAKAYIITVYVKPSGSSYSSSPVQINLRKIGNDYYNSANEKVTVSGSPEGSDFTIKSIGGSGYAFTDLRFVRK